MQVLEHEKLLALREGAELIEADHFGEKVLRLADGTYLKLFRRKRLLTSAAWKPYARRFVDNASALARLDIPCPEVIGLYRIPSINRDAVHYRPLEGQTIRQIIGADLPPERARELRARLFQFIALLHRRGIYFRSAHLGNIVLTPTDQFGLIDIADLKFAWFRLGPFRRRRNLRHVRRYAGDRAWLDHDEHWRAIK